MSFFEEYGIRKFINAHDTYTVYGGSRMADNTLQAMREIAKHFVDMEQLQRKLGEKIAKMTHNEGAYITNGAAGALLLSASVCMVRGNMYHYHQLPNTDNVKNEIIVLRAQRNAYDEAVWTSGAKMVEIGDADETLEFELEGAINEKTAAVFYFLSSLYSRGSMELSKVIEIAHRKGIPVVVDAAAQLPPVENLWNITGMGADLVIFSGGKTICGPADSGLILGKKDLIEECIRFGAPGHGICRVSKTSRENMAGLFIALKNYLEQDQEKNRRILLQRNRIIAEMADEIKCIKEIAIIPYGPVGQTYPRLFIYLKENIPGELIVKQMYNRNIYIGYEKNRNAIYISPLNITDEEAKIVKANLQEILKEYTS